MFNNNILVGQRSTSFVDYKDKVEDYKTAKYACVDGWQGKPGYFKAKYREVYISGSALAGMFNEETDAIVKIDSSEYTPSTIMYVEGITPIRDNNHKTDYYAFAWREGNIVYWWTDADVAYLPAECNKLFNVTQKGNMKSFDFTGFDVTKVTKMNVMFSGATNLKSVTLGNMFYADNVTTLESMFSTCENLESIDLENFQAPYGKVTSLKMMFSGCKALNTTGFGSNFDTSKVTNMTHVFRYCESLENYPFPDNADFGSATSFEYIFDGCSSLKSADFTNKNIAKVENFKFSFNNCSSLESVDFTGCTAPVAIKNVISMFNGCTSLEEVTMDGWKMSTAAFDNNNCFSNSGVKKLYLTNWEINYVGNNSNNLKGLVNSASELEELSIKGGIIKSSDNSRQFKFLNNNTKLTKVDLSDLEWRNDSLSLEWAFSECIHLEEIDVSGWKIKKLTNTPDFTKENQLTWFSSLKSKKDYFIQGILYNNIPVGVMGLKNITQVQAEYWGYIGEIDFWGKGIGSTMMDVAIQKAKELNLEKIYLTVLEDNFRAKNLYKKFNFKEKEGSKDGLVYMELELK